MKRLINTESGAVAICGTGPSGRDLRYCEYSYPIIFLNGAIANFYQFEGDYHLFTDGGLVDEYYPKSGPWPCKTITRKRLIQAYNIDGYGFDPVNYRQLPEVDIEDNSLFCGTTVCASALMLAVKIGFTEIHLFGCDFSSPWIDTRNWPKMEKQLNAVTEWARKVSPCARIIQANPDSRFQPVSPCGEKG